jgi:hypothetical protein
LVHKVGVSIERKLELVGLMGLIWGFPALGVCTNLELFLKWLKTQTFLTITVFRYLSFWVVISYIVMLITRYKLRQTLCHARSPHTNTSAYSAVSLVV